MHHGSRHFPARWVTAGVSAESAGVCKTPSVICGLGFHGLDFKQCLARLTSASSHIGALSKCQVGASAASQGLWWSKDVGRGGRGSLRPNLRPSHRSRSSRDCRELLGFFPATDVNHVMDTLAPSVGGGCGEFWEGALPRGRPPERAGPAAQPFKTS